MIRLGLDNAAKSRVVQEYCTQHGITKVFLLSPARFRFDPGTPCDQIEYADLIMYKTYYRMLQETNATTLIVINECLKTQNRHDLTYNCIRNFLNQTRHQIVFQYLPLIDTFDDFMVLVDWETRSKWKREKFRPDMLPELDLQVTEVTPTFLPTQISVDAQTQSTYAKQKRKLIDSLGLGDPHTIPRNLLLLAGKAKLQVVDPKGTYVGRNNRFKLSNLLSYKEPAYPTKCCIFELCHNFIDCAGFLTLSRQRETTVLLTDLKVDQWYFTRYQEWAERIQGAYSALQW